jgi:F-type H+-transporting ATPase subunit c
MLSKWTRTLPVMVALLFVATSAFAQDGGSANDYKGMIGLSTGLIMGMAVLGGGLAQGYAARGALEGISRNPQASGKIQTPMLIGLAFIESLVIFGFVIAFLLQGKI